MPPRSSGRSSTPGRMHRPPVPCGPIRPLWPVKQSTSMPIFCISISAAPAGLRGVDHQKRAVRVRHRADPGNIEHISGQIGA